jgi:hypothetical protein
MGRFVFLTRIYPFAFILPYPVHPAKPSPHFRAVNIPSKQGAAAGQKHAAARRGLFARSTV